MIAFIDTYRNQLWVEFICRVLRAAIPGGSWINKPDDTGEATR